MKTIHFVVVVLIILSACKKDEFNTGVIPGEYTGALYYYQLVNSNDGEHLINIPDLSKSSEYKITVTSKGSGYLLSFDKAYIFTIPDITVEISSIMNSGLAAISTLSGQSYSSSSALVNFPNYPANNFTIYNYVRRVDLNLTLKCNDPDSTSFLQFILLRIY